MLPIFAVVIFVGLTACSETEVLNLQNGPKISPKFEKMLDDYADVIVKSALNIQNGQKVIIQSTVPNYYFADKCMDKAYEAGASDVKIFWQDEYENHQRAKLSTKDSLSEDMMFDYETKDAYTSLPIAYLNLASNNPNINSDLSEEQLGKYSKAKSAASKGFSKRSSSNEFQWTVASIPQTDWAKKVFPGKSDDEAATSLWTSIFETVYVTGDGKAIDRWENHMNALKESVKKMNNYQFKTLHYTNSSGTNLTYDLPDKHIWKAASSKTPYGVEFYPNVPTEEIYCAPKRDSVNGKVYSSRPLIINGNMVENFYFVVKDGKIVEVHAETGEDILKSEIENNEGADYFGEVALVPFDSTISRQNMVYYDTIYDENASCHMAFGYAYPDCIENGENLTDEELKQAGLNTSSTHIDFMVGTSDLKIIGTTKDGREVVVFENGNWAI